jgi:hypothetical protein
LAKRKYKSPSTSAKCGYVLKKAALVEKGNALRQVDMHRLNRIICFIQLYEEEWGNKVTNPALRNLAFKKNN